MPPQKVRPAALQRFLLSKQDCPLLLDHVIAAIRLYNRQSACLPKGVLLKRTILYTEFKETDESWD